MSGGQSCAGRATGSGVAVRPARAHPVAAPSHDPGQRCSGRSPRTGAGTAGSGRRARPRAVACPGTRPVRVAG
ncbi:hypothetical protein B446_22375 [Streptomyces collinus Tu 365]|uniref:Uncharacterized protein n=1 Tax=Streptomyces collinus (strain DSM 40733 / Tue 365) TaxID=1214242 RepID=S5VL36_STRC3|nr:hypothetical protein B446_22375 [Streptomyces collinus Tu 365]